MRRKFSFSNHEFSRTFALVGNPNTGKTTLFNALTGLRQKVANYPGVTVEKKTGTGRNRHGEAFAVIDLPGAYSLEPKSPDEEVTRAVLHGERPDTPRPDAVICLVDAGNLERHLYLATQVMELDLPVIVVVNKTDTAEERGVTVATKKLAERLGVPVVPMQANERVGMEALQVALSAEPVKANWKPVEGDTAARYKAIGKLIEGAVARDGEERLTPSDRWDGVLVHPVFGWLVLLGILGGLFFTLFSLAGYPMDLIDGTFGWLSSQVEDRMADGDLRALITEGIIGGVGGGDFSTADSHSIFLYRPHGKHRLPRPCVLHDGSPDGRRRPERQSLCAVAQLLRLRHPRNHGHAHDGKCARPADYHPGRAHHQLLRAPAGVRHAHRADAACGHRR